MTHSNNDSMSTASNETEQRPKIRYKITVEKLGTFKPFQIIINTNTNAQGGPIFSVWTCLIRKGKMLLILILDETFFFNFLFCDKK